MLFIKKAKAKQWRHNLKHHTCVVYKVCTNKTKKEKKEKKKEEKKKKKKKRKK